MEHPLNNHQISERLLNTSEDFSTSPLLPKLIFACSLEVIEVGHSDALPRALSSSPWFTNVRHVQRDQLRSQMEP